MFVTLQWRQISGYAEAWRRVLVIVANEAGAIAWN
jgi:hypothetical protein